MGDVYFRPIDVSPDGKQLLGAGWDQTERRSVLAVMPTDRWRTEPIPEVVGGGAGVASGRTRA